MPALSFQEEWLDMLLTGSKKQTTRPRTDRIKVGDICHIYNQQRRRIDQKEMRTPTTEGADMIYHHIEVEGNYPRPHLQKGRAYSIDPYYAHFLGKVYISEVYDMIPAANSTQCVWAADDGFDNFIAADTWFTQRYGMRWQSATWTVIRWSGWTERYFEPC